MGLLPLLSPTRWRGALRVVAAARSRSCGRRHCGATYMTPEQASKALSGGRHLALAWYYYHCCTGYAAEAECSMRVLRQLVGPLLFF